MRKAARAAAVGGLAVVLFAAGALGLWRSVRREVPPPAPASVDRTLRSSPAVGRSSLARMVATLQERVRAVPGDWRAHASLGLAYVQQARVTGDPTYYPKAEGVLRRSLQLRPDRNFEALTGMAALAAARHQFALALSWGERARAVNPDSAGVRAVVGDALLELGRYREAFAAYQQAVDLRPDLATYARASYARELQGDLAGARRAMEMALAAAGDPADAAWAAHQLGELSWNAGRVGPAARMYRMALRLDPSFVPPRVGLARVRAARGRTEAAIRDLEAVVRSQPLPEHVILLGDLLAASGRRAEAERQYALVDVEARLLRANGVNVDLEIALFHADRGRAAEALSAARAEWARRKSVHVADAMAWALHAAGRDREALAFARRALALGTRSALFLFHRGMIEHALGREGAARRDLAAALRTNPHFSFRWSARAQEVLAGLGGKA